MRALSWCLPVIAVLLLLSSVAHALLGWPPIRAGLEQARVAEDLVGAIAVGWHFGSVSMAVLGVIVFLSWREIRAQRPMGRAAAASIALSYALFGAVAFLLRSFNPHFIVAFVLPGLILGLPVVAARWQHR